MWGPSRPIEVNGFKSTMDLEGRRPTLRVVGCSFFPQPSKIAVFPPQTSLPCSNHQNDGADGTGENTGIVWYTTVQCSTVQYSTVQYSTVYSTVQYCTVSYSIQYSTVLVQYSTVQYTTVWYSTLQYSTVQYSTVQCSTSTVRYSIVWYSTVLVQYGTV